MTFDFGSFNNWGQLKKVAVRDVATAFASDAKIDAEWKDLNFHSRPDLENAEGICRRRGHPEIGRRRSHQASSRRWPDARFDLHP
jgi:predicted metalloprotease